MNMREPDLKVEYFVQVEDATINNSGGSLHLKGWTNWQKCKSEDEAKDVMATVKCPVGKLRVARVTTATLAVRD